MTVIAFFLVGCGCAAIGYAYAGYPAILSLLGLLRRTRSDTEDPSEWPDVTITVPVYNEESAIASTLDMLLALDYPSEQCHILVLSDASTDRTEEIVADYADRGVELLRLEQRRGKTAAENAAIPHVKGEIVVNIDATAHIPAEALKHLVAVFSDDSVGVASGRDVSVARMEGNANLGESGYVGYEMWIRRLETAIYGIVGASGCFFANRRELHKTTMPEELSRDFAAPLVARERGYRSVSVDKAICFVPRTGSLRNEYQRKVRTMARGIQTLFFKRHLMNPFRFGLFGWMLFSHKLARWFVPWGCVTIVLGIALLTPAFVLARWILGATASLLVVGTVGWLWIQKPRLFAIPAYLVAGIFAGLHAWTRAIRGAHNPIWEPTRRAGADTTPPG